MKKVLWKLIGDKNYELFKQKFLTAIENKFLRSGRICYSQMGEDMILQNLFQSKEKGFFVDIGAFHPTNISNTYHFYKKGWRGINVDATPGSMEMFKLLRPHDINLEIGVADKECQMNYYLYHSKALNTFSEDGVKYVKAQFDLDPYRSVETNFMPLSKILDTYFPNSVNQIDFLSIDVEGADEVVLLSNNWEKYKPKVICIERHMNYNEFKDTTVCKFLESMNYIFAAKTGPSYFYYLIENF